MDYYSLQKRVLELRAEVAALEFEKQTQPLKDKLKFLENMSVNLNSNVAQTLEVLNDFNKNKPQIEKALENSKYIHMERKSANHMKSIYGQAIEIFQNPIVETDELPAIQPRDRLQDNPDDAYVASVGEKLIQYEQFCKIASTLVSNINAVADVPRIIITNTSDDHQFTSSQSDDTITSIISEYVVASSPIS